MIGSRCDRGRRVMPAHAGVRSAGCWAITKNLGSHGGRAEAESRSRGETWLPIDAKPAPRSRKKPEQATGRFGSIWNRAFQYGYSSPEE